MTLHRKVSGLVYAQVCPKPDFIPHSRPKGTRGQGLSYERKLAKALPQAHHGLWFRYVDSNGEGYCSPDLILPTGGGLVVLECKLTLTLRAFGQLSELYLPVVGKAFGLPTRGVVVCKNLSWRAQQLTVAESLAQALAQPPATIPVLHWLARSAP